MEKNRIAELFDVAFQYAFEGYGVIVVSDQVPSVRSVKNLPMSHVQHCDEGVYQFWLDIIVEEQSGTKHEFSILCQAINYTCNSVERHFQRLGK
jgi:hypothetical protein